MTVINGLTNTVDATITVGVRAGFLLINPLTNKIYVVNHRDNTVSVINGATNTVIKTISVGSNPTYGDINLVTNRIYVVNNGNGQGTTMSVIDGNTDTDIATVTVGNYPQGASVNPVTNKIYVSNYCGNQFGCNATPAQGTVSVVDGATNTVTNTVTVGVAAQVIFADPVTNKIWVLNSVRQHSKLRHYRGQLQRYRKRDPDRRRDLGYRDCQYRPGIGRAGVQSRGQQGLRLQQHR